MRTADTDNLGDWRSSRSTPFWLDTPLRPPPRPALRRDTHADLAVVGGGFSGLWTALIAKERDPGRDVVLLEGGRIAWAASGRNGGFCNASLTHGEANGLAHAARDYEVLKTLGEENLEEIEQTLEREQIDCAFARTGTLNVALEPYQDQAIRAEPGYLNEIEVREQVNSPTYIGGVWRRGSALLDPARLAWGLARAAEAAGVRIHEGSPVTGIEANPRGVAVKTTGGIVRADRVALGTNAFTPLLRRTRLHVVPVYDYVLVTEPLTDPQMNAIGWKQRQGIHDGANQFHYYGLTPDNRILYGGYDAIYHFGRKVREAYDCRDATHALLARQFFETFPQLGGIRFTHRWGGAIDTCTRFFAFHGQAFGGRVSYSLGHTGLGVAATRFGAKVMLDQLSGRETELTSLETVRRKPLPFPPEPFAYLAIQATRWSLAKADAHQGRRNLWLRSLDALGVGFDS
jgi:glycine/D-amino acid oxidase-like deaminating enzyme